MERVFLSNLYKLLNVFEVIFKSIFIFLFLDA